jgi:hypothetical protein
MFGKAGNATNLRVPHTPLVFRDSGIPVHSDWYPSRL